MTKQFPTQTSWWRPQGLAQANDEDCTTELEPPQPKYKANSLHISVNLQKA